MINFDYSLPDIDQKHDVLPINGEHGVCRSYYQPDQLDIKALEYADELMNRSHEKLYALDLGCSPYCPESQRLAKLGFYVDAIDIENPIDNFKKINESYQNRINYITCDLTKISAKDLRDDYKIIYSNRCLSFLTYQDARKLILMLAEYIKCDVRFFLAFFSTKGHYAEGYPIDLPLETRFKKLDNEISRRDSMLAPVCLYTRDEIYEKLLSGLSIKVVEELQVKTGSIKIIFDLQKMVND